MKINEKRSRLEELERQRSELNHQISELRKEIKLLRESIAEHDLEEHFSNGLSFESVLAVSWTLLDNSRTWYHKIQNWIEQQPGIYQSGYFPDTDQCALKICLTRDKPLSEQRAIEQAYPYIKPLSRDNKIHISIFENTLSEFGIFSLKCTTPEQPPRIELCRTTHGWETKLKEWDNWDDALSYIQKITGMNRNVRSRSSKCLSSLRTSWGNSFILGYTS